MNRKLWLIVSILVIALLAGCQSAVAPAPINATYDMAGPPIPGEAINFEDTCLLPIEISWVFAGDVEGIATFQTQIMHDGLCEPDTQYGDLNEHWVATGIFEGAVNGHEGTFEFFLVAQLIDLYYTAQLAIEPGSGTGDLTGINGIIKFNEEPGDEPPWPVTGYYYYDVMSGAPMLQEP